MIYMIYMIYMNKNINMNNVYYNQYAIIDIIMKTKSNGNHQFDYTVVLSKNKN